MGSYPILNNAYKKTTFGKCNGSLFLYLIDRILMVRARNFVPVGLIEDVQNCAENNEEEVHVSPKNQIQKNHGKELFALS